MKTYCYSLRKIAVRSGDYYLFADLDEKIELDLINERASAGIEDTMAEKKLADKMTIEQVSVRFDIPFGKHVMRATSYCTSKCGQYLYINVNK